MTDSFERTLRARFAQELPERLVGHIDRVVEIAGDLARRWGLDVERARLMAQAHDVVRHYEDAEWLNRAEAYGIPIEDVDRTSPVLLHGPVGAEELRRRFGVTDEDLLSAVWWHTPGHPSYSGEAWAMFIADKVEPHKARKWDALQEVHRLAREESLQAAALLYVDLRLRQGLDQGGMISPHMVVTRNFLLGRLERVPKSDASPLAD